MKKMDPKDDASTKRWTDEDEQFLRENYQNMTNKDLADKFGVSTISIQRKLSRLGFIRQVQKKWEGDEEEFLRKNYQAMDDKDLAKHYGVTEISIKRKLTRLGLKRDMKKKTQPAEKPVAQAPAAPKVQTSASENVKVKPVKVSTKGSQEKEYDRSLTYKVGEYIYHRVWKVRGKVIDKIQTSGGNKAIIVEFSEFGRKTLQEGYKEV
jgi:Zn-dependent peptidase ImmA (M78 family)